jgi:hypothetical protein
LGVESCVANRGAVPPGLMLFSSLYLPRAYALG